MGGAVAARAADLRKLEVEIPGVWEDRAKAYVPKITNRILSSAPN